MYVGAAVLLSHWKAAQLRNSYPKNPGKNMVSHVSSNATTLNEPAKKFLFYNRVLEWIPELVKHTKVPITLLIFHHQWNRFVPHTYYSQTWLKKYSYLNWNASHQEWYSLIWKELKDFVFWNISQYVLAILGCLGFFSKKTTLKEHWWISTRAHGFASYSRGISSISLQA